MSKRFKGVKNNGPWYESQGLNALAGQLQQTKDVMDGLKSGGVTAISKEITIDDIRAVEISVIIYEPGFNMEYYMNSRENHIQRTNRIKELEDKVEMLEEVRDSLRTQLKLKNSGVVVPQGDS